MSAVRALGFSPFFSPLESSLLNIAICVATRWEFQALGRALPFGHTRVVLGYRCLIYQEDNLKVLVLQTGMGPEKVTKAFHSVLSHQSWDLIVSSGFAGALVPTAVGTLVVSSQVFDLDHSRVLDFHGQSEAPGSRFYTLAREVASEIDDLPLIGSVVMVRRIIWQASQKMSIAEHTQGLALDMESGTIGQLARDCSGAFLVVRTITDLVNESLPMDINVFYQKSTWIQGVFQLLLHPRQVWAFTRLRKQTLVAGTQLTHFFQAFCARLGECPPSH